MCSQQQDGQRKALRPGSSRNSKETGVTGVKRMGTDRGGRGG